MFQLLISVARFDPPEVLNAGGGTPIPGSASAPLQVIASLPADVFGIEFLDGIGQFIGVYQGPPGSEKYVTTIGGSGSGFKRCFIKAGTRVSLRSMESSSITTGKMSCDFLG